MVTRYSLGDADDSTGNASSSITRLQALLVTSLPKIINIRVHLEKGVMNHWYDKIPQNTSL